MSLYYRIIDFKVCQTELVIAITQIYRWKVAYREDTTFAGQCKCQRHV